MNTQAPQENENIYEPDELTMRATRLGISPIYFEDFISIENISNILVCETVVINELVKSTNLIPKYNKNDGEKYIEVKSLIMMLSFYVRANPTPYQAWRVKDSMFIPKEQIKED